jgi:tetratricopeptide (TPR) repeat protein
MTSSSDAAERNRLQQSALGALQAGRMQEAVTHFEALIPLLDPEDVKTRLLSYWGLGAAHMALSCHADALSAFEEVLLLLEISPHERMEATCLASLSEAHAFLGQHREALQFGERAVVGFERLRQPIDVARWTNNLGLSHAHLGTFEKARACYERARGIARDARAQDLEAAALGNLGQLLIEELGDVDQGVRCLEEALALFRELQDYGGVAKTLTNIGSAKMLRLGEVGEAIGLFGEAQMLARLRDDRALLGHLQNLLDTAAELLKPSGTADDESWNFLLQLGGDGTRKEGSGRPGEDGA